MLLFKDIHYSQLLLLLVLLLLLQSRLCPLELLTHLLYHLKLAYTQVSSSQKLLQVLQISLLHLCSLVPIDLLLLLRQAFEQPHHATGDWAIDGLPQVEDIGVQVGLLWNHILGRLCGVQLDMLLDNLIGLLPVLLLLFLRQLSEVLIEDTEWICLAF